jgi:hypothetical protein
VHWCSCNQPASSAAHHPVAVHPSSYASQARRVCKTCSNTCSSRCQAEHHSTTQISWTSAQSPASVPVCQYGVLEHLARSKNALWLSDYRTGSLSHWNKQFNVGPVGTFTTSAHSPVHRHGMRSVATYQVRCCHSLKPLVVCGREPALYCVQQHDLLASAMGTVALAPGAEPTEC